MGPIATKRIVVQLPLFGGCENYKFQRSPTFNHHAAETCARCRNYNSVSALD